MIIRVYMAPDGAGGGGTAAPSPAEPAAAPVTEPAGGTAEPAAETGSAADAGNKDDGWKGTWVAQLPDEMKTKHQEYLASLKDKPLSDIVDGYMTAEGKLQRAIVPPGQGATPEEIKAFLDRMGIPVSPDGYGLDPALVNDPTGAFTADFAGIMAKLGVTKTQGKALFNHVAALSKTGLEQLAAQQQAQADSFEERLEQEIGDKARSTETKEHFKRFLVRLGDKALVRELEESGVIYSTRFAQAMAGFHREHLTDPVYVPGQSGSKSGKGPAGMPVSPEFDAQYGGRK